MAPPSSRAVALRPCAGCGTPVALNAQSGFRPFCSGRRKLLDPGAQADESYRIPVDDLPDDDPSLPEPDERWLSAAAARQP